MSPVFRGIVILAVAAALCAATFILVPFLRNSGSVPGGIELTDDGDFENEPEEVFSAKTAAAVSSRSGQPVRNGQAKSSVDREKAKFDVGEMRNEFEEMVRKFRGTPEERQEVIDECRDGRELIQLVADLSVSSIEKMSPEELEQERESFEKNFRAQLDFIQTGQLQRMLKTPEEQEVIGATVEAARDFLERLDSALHAAGY